MFSTAYVNIPTVVSILEKHRDIEGSHYSSLLSHPAPIEHKQKVRSRRRISANMNHMRDLHS